MALLPVRTIFLRAAACPSFRRIRDLDLGL
jgi:hypothetical protein